MAKEHIPLDKTILIRINTTLHTSIKASGVPFSDQCRVALRPGLIQLLKAHAKDPVKVLNTLLEEFEHQLSGAITEHGELPTKFTMSVVLE
jgi:hypothetical protein